MRWAVKVTAPVVHVSMGWFVVGSVITVRVLHVPWMRGLAGALPLVVRLTVNSRLRPFDALYPESSLV